MSLSHISFRTMADHYTRIDSGDEIVQPDWCYHYDCEFFDAPIDPDMRVRPEWVGQRARDVACAWEYFMRPVHDYAI